MFTALFVVAAVIAVAGFFLFNVYNKLVSLRERVRNAFAQIDAQLERRHA